MCYLRLFVYQTYVYSEDPVYIPSDYCKAAYSHWTLWRCGYLGRGNQQVVSACAVWAVWDKYIPIPKCYLHPVLRL